MSQLFSTLSRYILLAQGRRRRKSPARASAGRIRQRTRLYLETLEDRTVPSASISVANASINEIGNVSALVPSGSGGLSTPKDLVLGPNGNLYVASFGTNSVIRYTPTGQLLGTFVAAGSGGLSSPYGLAFGPDGNLYVDSVTNNNILEYNGSTGAFLSTFVTAGSGGLNEPVGMVFGQDGNLYVSSSNTESVLRFQGPTGPAPGSPLPAAGQSGATFVAPMSGGLVNPFDLVFGPNGNMFVSSTTNGAVLEFNGSSGNFVANYVASGSGGLISPRGLAFDQDGRLYVADAATGAIHRYDSQGNYLDDPVTSYAAAASSVVPIGMVFNAQGALLVSSRDANGVAQYDSGVVLTLSASSPSPVSVQYDTVDGAAKAGTDYTAQTGTVTFAPGQTSRLILLATLEDPVPLSNDAFSVQLSNPTGGETIANGTAVVTIVQPTWPQISVANTSAIEGDTTAHYRGAFVQSPGNQFNPVTFGPDGNLYTAVGTGPGYNTIERFNGNTGAFMGTFASGPINGVRTIVFRGGYMYVASEYTNQVLQYDATTGAYVGVFVAAGSGGINGPNGMAMDSAGNLYVAGRNSNTIVKYDTNGNPLWATPAGSGGLNLPEGMTVDPSGTYLLVANSGSPSAVLKFNTQTGAYVGVAASTGLNSPHSVAFGSDGLLYVSSGGNNRILRFTANGTYVDDYIPAGSGGLASPHAIAFGPNGDLYVATTGNDQIFQYGTENEALFTVSLSASFVLPVTVNYASADGTAATGTNYVAASGMLALAPGVTSETIRVPILDSGSQTAPLTFTVKLSSPLAAKISNGQGVGTILPSDTPATFYVVNGATSAIGGTNTTYKYQASGSPEAPYGLSLNDLDPRGVATTAAGTTEWVVDANKNVYVYSSGGTLLGSWSAAGLSSSAQITGITTNGTDIWLLDSYADKVYRYAGAASRLSGSQSAASSFSLASGNGNFNPQGIATDGTSFWVVDGSALKVFKYTLTGALLGNWGIDPANLHPTGITIDPANVSNIWIVDNGTDKVYQYTAAASRTSGSQRAATTFALASSNTNPLGIAVSAAGTHFAINAPSSTTAGNDLVYDVTALDPSNNVAKGYSGTVHFSSSDGQAALPADAVLPGGIGFFSAYLKTAGNQTITATDTASAAITGVSGAVTVSPAAAARFAVQAPANVTTGSNFVFTVTAVDAFNNRLTSYNGTVQVSSSDAAAALPASSTLAAGTGTFSAVLKTVGTQTLTAADSVSSAITGTSAAINARGLVVTGLTPTATGFLATFDKPFDPTQLNLYDPASANLGPADVTLLGPSGTVRGSLLLDPTDTTITFVKTSTLSGSNFDPSTGLLAPGTYTATFRSASNGFKDLTGSLLDGNNNGMPGTNFVTTFVVNSAGVAVGIPSFARGPNGSQDINLPNTASSASIPLALSNGAGVTSGQFVLQYNSALLNIIGVTVNSALTGATLALDPVSSAGNAVIDFSTTGTLSSGVVRLGGLVATVPNSAASSYKDKALLHFASASINGGAIAALGDDAVQIVAYPGDVSGTGTYSPLDAALISSVAANSATGFAAYALLDPVIVGDLTGNGSVNSASVTLMNTILAGKAEPQVPSIPSGLTIVPTGPDPTLSIGSTELIPFYATPGSTLIVPVNIDTARPNGSTGMMEAILALRFNPTEFSVSAADVELGTLPSAGSGWQLQTVVNNQTGEIGIDLFSTTPIQSSAGGSLVTIALHVREPVPAGSTELDIVAQANPTGQRIYETMVADTQGALVLHTALSAAATEPGESSGLGTDLAPAAAHAAGKSNLLTFAVAGKHAAQTSAMGAAADIDLGWLPLPTTEPVATRVASAASSWLQEAIDGVFQTWVQNQSSNDYVGALTLEAGVADRLPDNLADDVGNSEPGHLGNIAAMQK